MDRKEIKNAAKQSIKGKIWSLFGVGIVAFVIMGAVELVPVLGLLASFFVVTPAIIYGLLIIYFKVAKNEEFAFADLFSKFNEFWPMFKVMFFSGLYTALWSLLLFVPGIIKGFSYSQCYYILLENPTMGANDAITLSRKMMDGHKWEYFVFLLSFIGWYLLVTVTFGIAAIYVIPYLQTAQINFYYKVKAAYEGKANAEVIM